jgi:hypothetical protein
MKKINELAVIVHEANKKWWTDINTGNPIPRNLDELLLLVITEIAEATEGLRKNLQDDKLPHRKMEEVELADAVIRLLDIAGGFQFKLYEFNHVAFQLGDTKTESLFEICCAITSAILPTNAMRVSVAISMIESYCEKYELDLDGAIKEKLIYNSKREDHKHEHRKGEHGKKF